MQNPQNDIKKVLRLLIPPVSPDIQQGAVRKYFAEEAAYRSPLFHIPSRSFSREEVLGIYQWQQVMSTKNQIDITKVVFDEESNTLYVELTQLSKMRFSPFKPAPFNFLIRFKLAKVGDEYQITSQEDFFHSDEFLKCILAPFAMPVRVTLCAASYATVLCAKFAQAFGYWRAGEGIIQGNSTGNDPSNTKENNGNAEEWKESKNGKHN